jgi:lipopolysaccharide transport system permease protein
MALALKRPQHAGDLVRELVSRDIKLRYRRSILGIAWSQLAPLAMIGVLTFVFQSVIQLKIEHYPAFLFTGLLAWLWFQSGMVAATQSIVNNRDLIRQPGFPVPMLPVVSIGTGLINYLLSLPVLFIWIGVSLGGLPVTAVALPAIVATQFLLMLGPAYILSALHVTFRDVGHIVEIALLPLFYATPILYKTIPARFHLVADLNPLAQVMRAYHDCLIDGRWPSAVSLGAVAAFGVLLLFGGARIFERRSGRFVEEL